MPTEAIVKTISLIIAPVVMISACAIIVNGLIVRYATLGERARVMYLEQLNLLEQDLKEKEVRRNRLHDVEHLLPDLLEHHHQVHSVLVLIYLAILIFLLDMIVIAVAVSTNIPWLSQAVIIVFLMGVGFLFWGMVLISIELSSSHGMLQKEMQLTCQLCKKSDKKLR
jgi:Protein of unknown function (DUF2721)